MKICHLFLSSTSIALLLSTPFLSSVSYTMERAAHEQKHPKTHTNAVMAASDIERVTVIENKNPNYRKAVNKVKNHLQTMQARKRDYIQVLEALVNQFVDVKTDTIKKLEIIDPVWLETHEKNRSNQADPRDRLKSTLTNRWATLHVARDQYQERLMGAKNGLKGYASLIELCDQYLSEQDPSQLTRLLDSLLASHLLSLSGTVKRYIPTAGKEDMFYSHLSLKMDELNTYYTQDARLEALSELYYITDFVRPIHTLLKTGLQPDAKDWSFCVTMQKYIKSTVTLDDPSVFLLDGFLFRKGIEKADTSINLINALSKISSNIQFGGVVRGDALQFEPLSYDEMTIAMKEYTNLYDLHRERVNAYIKKVKGKNQDYIRKSREFLEATLNGNSGFQLEQQVTPQESEPVVVKKTKRRPHRNKNSASQQRQANDLVPTVTSQTQPSNLEIKAEDTSLTPPKQAPELLEDKVISTKSQASQESLEPPQVAAFAIATTTLPKIDVASPQLISTPPTLRIAPRLMNEIKEVKPKPYSINNAHLHIIFSLLDATTRPFTIHYSQALNAMTKIDIFEHAPKRKGDFRKLVRIDFEGKSLGQVSAYFPATSTIGYELMKIYRDFIKEQLKDRADLKALIG